MISYFSPGEMSQFKPDLSIYKGRLIGSWCREGQGLVGLLVPGRSPRGGRQQGGERDRRKERPRCLGYIGKSHWGTGSPDPGLEGLGLRAGYAR